MRPRFWLLLPAVVGFSVSLFIFVLAVSTWLGLSGGYALWDSLRLPLFESVKFDLFVFESFIVACMFLAAVFVSFRWSIKSSVAASVLWFAAPSLMVYEFGLQRYTALFGTEVMQEHFVNVTAARFPWLTNNFVLYVAILLFDVGVAWAFYKANPAKLSGRWRILSSLVIFAAAFSVTAWVYSINYQYDLYMSGRFQTVRICVQGRCTVIKKT